MKVLTYTSHEEHFELHTEIHHPIAINICHIEFARKAIILLSDTAVILYETCSSMGAQDIYIYIYR